MAYKAKRVLKNLTFNALCFFNAQKFLRNIKERENRTTVLCLHRISDEYDYFWDPIKPGDFEQLIKYILKYYDVISVEDISRKPGKRPRLILSFDDGYYDFYTNVLPVLKHYSLPANHNIVTDIVNGKQDVIWTEKLNFLFNYFRQNTIAGSLKIGMVEFQPNEHAMLDSHYIAVLKELFKLEQHARLGLLNELLNRYSLQIVPKKMMGWAEIIECADHGVNIGSHTKTHPVLSSIKNEAELYTEIVDSKLEIEKNLKRKISAFAPPNGLSDPATLKQAAGAGYQYILGIGSHSSAEIIENNMTFINRLNLISEPYANMVLRIEELQSNLKKLLAR
jgi:peptidoglycan/xylan/chitin deacetylase (PgdA/CDA1 family)